MDILQSDFGYYSFDRLSAGLVERERYGIEASHFDWCDRFVQWYFDNDGV